MCEKTIENLTYQVYDDHAVVVKCNIKSTRITSVVIPPKIDSTQVTEIGEFAFYNCTSLGSLVIPNSVTEIGKYAFYNCTSLKEIGIPNSVTEIGKYAFYNCTSLKEIGIPNSVTEIGKYAFASCKSLTKVAIPDNIRKIFKTAFENCPNIQRVNFSQALVNRPDSNQIFNQVVDSGLRTYEVVFQKPSM